MKEKKVLFVASSIDQIVDTQQRTGLWLEEFAAAYYIFKDAGANISLASTSGGAVPIDPKSQSIIMITRSGKRFLNDPDALEFLEHSSTFEEVHAEDFELVFVFGGYGALLEFPDHEPLGRLLQSINDSDKLLGAVSQGVAALLLLKNDQGQLFIKGKKVTGFSNNEEEARGLNRSTRVLLEDRLVVMGALYSKGASHASYLVTDGNIITGQNPVSSEAVARKIIALLEDRKHSLQATIVV